MIEVLITLVILSIGLLGVANMQILGLTYNQNAYYRSQATQLADGIIEKMRMNPAGVTAGDYSGGTSNGDFFQATFTLSSGVPAAESSPTLGTISDCRAARCNSSKIAAFDLNNWLSDIMSALPTHMDSDNNALTTATITFYTGNRFTVIITWGEKQEDAANANKLFTDDFTSRNVTLYIQL